MDGVAWTLNAAAFVANATNNARLNTVAIKSRVNNGPNLPMRKTLMFGKTRGRGKCIPQRSLATATSLRSNRGAGMPECGH